MSWRGVKYLFLNSTFKVHGDQQPVLYGRRPGEADREEEAGDDGQHQPHVHSVLQVGISVFYSVLVNKSVAVKFSL